MNRAVKLLAAKPRSIGELRERLAWKRAGQTARSSTQSSKSSANINISTILNYAHDLAVSKLRQQPQGKRRLKQSLSQKKLDKETVDEAIAPPLKKFRKLN